MMPAETEPMVVFVDVAERPAFRRRVAELAQVSHLDDWEIPLRPRRDAPFAAALTAASMGGGMLPAVSLSQATRFTLAHDGHRLLRICCISPMMRNMSDLVRVSEEICLRGRDDVSYLL